MRLFLAHRVVVPSVILSLGLVIPAFAQSENDATARQQMNAAGQSLKQAGSDTVTAGKYAYHGAVTAVSDSTITAKVKAALHRDNTTEHSDIHVKTSAGIVTLQGRVASTSVAERAQELAQDAKGVRAVKNHLEVSGPTIAD